MLSLTTPRSVRAAASAVVVVTALLLATGASAAPVTTVNGFVNYQLGGLPAEYCPDPNSPCQNGAAEPAIRADGFGNFFGSSENGIGGGTEAWKSIDGGLHYVHLPSPNTTSSAVPNPGTNPGGVNTSPAGGDTDLSTASDKNSLGTYNVYVASLELANVNLSTSVDGGHSWSQNPVAANLPGDDREWTAADGASKVCVSYRDLAAAGIHVGCSSGAGAPPFVPGEAIDAAHAFLATNFQIGNLMIDQHSNLSDSARNNDIVYQTFSGIADTTADLTNCSTIGTVAPCNTHVVYMAVSRDGGRTFTDYTVQNGPATVSYGHQFVNVSVDAAGNVYSFFSDDHNVYYKYSTDHGVTWNPRAPVRVNKPASYTAIFPWSAAGAAGKVDLVWYGTSFFQPGVAPDNYPPSAAWHVFFSQNLNATGCVATSCWNQVRASPIVHYGGVCENGIGCTGNRDLYDDFGVAARPTTGLASIIYSDDQFDQYNTSVLVPPNPLRPPCDATQNNSVLCDHTSIATQTSGTGIY